MTDRDSYREAPECRRWGISVGNWTRIMVIGMNLNVKMMRPSSNRHRQELEMEGFDLQQENLIDDEKNDQHGQRKTVPCVCVCVSVCD